MASAEFVPVKTYNGRPWHITGIGACDNRYNKREAMTVLIE